MYRRSVAEYVECERNTPLGPKQRSRFDAARKLMQMTEESLSPAAPSPTPTPTAAATSTGKP